MFTKENINIVFKGELIGKEIIFLDSTTSTNFSAMEIGTKREDPEGIVVVADSQTHGKGRLGRKWVSPPGVNLYFTIILVPPFPPKDASILTLAAAVAVVSAIRSYTGLKAEIKWPNDIFLNGKKTGGILLEMRSGEDRINLLTLGIGINVNMSLSDLPEEIRSLSTSLKIENDGDVDRAVLLGNILEELESSYKILLNGNKRALINEWIRLNCTLGNRVMVQSHDRIFSGMAEDINENGELIIRLSSGAIETVNAGDVTILKN